MQLDPRHAVTLLAVLLAFKLCRPTTRAPLLALCADITHKHKPAALCCTAVRGCRKLLLGSVLLNNYYVKYLHTDRASVYKDAMLVSVCVLVLVLQ